MPYQAYLYRGSLRIGSGKLREVTVITAFPPPLLHTNSRNGQTISRSGLDRRTRELDRQLAHC